VTSAALTVNLVLIGAVVAYLVSRAYPLTELVRVRNAMLLARTRPGDFDWTPENAPPDFRFERRQPSPEFVEVVHALGVDRLDDDWQKALALAGHLTEVSRGAGPIQSDLATTYGRIREGGGYCADFVRVFLALAYTADVVARQWAFSFDGFGGHGHTFIEAYDRRLSKWLFLDVYNNFHAVNPVSGAAMSAFEFRVALEGPVGTFDLRPNGPGPPGFRYPERALEYYRRGLGQWYLLWGNAVFSGDANPIVRAAFRISGGLGRLVTTFIGAQPLIRVLPTAENGVMVASLAGLRRRVCAATVALLALLVGLVVQLGR
jgi:hypothetical protein